MTTDRWRRPILTCDPEPVLTRRQAQVLLGICLGHSNAEIADRLHVAPDTVKTHVKRILTALGAVTRVHAASIAMSGQVAIKVRAYDNERTGAA